jgi:putative ABC transport system permease protein
MLSVIVATFRKTYFVPLLLVAQMCLSCALLCNMVFLVCERIGPLLHGEGVRTNGLVVVSNIVAPDGLWKEAFIHRVGTSLSTVPGVADATPTLGVPLANSMPLTATVSAGRTTVDITAYVGRDLTKILGLDIVDGRQFSQSDYVDGTMANDFGMHGCNSVIITSKLAKRLFPEVSALGKKLDLIDGDKTCTAAIIGVVKKLAGSSPGNDDSVLSDYSLILPTSLAEAPMLTYAIRIKDGYGAEVLAPLKQAADTAISSSNLPGLRVTIQSFDDIRDDVFRDRRTSAWVFAVLIAIVVFITAMGNFSLTTYWIARRRRSIAIRRALGARIRDVWLYLTVENLLIAILGSASGMSLAYSFNVFLMQYYELPKLPAFYLPIGAAATIIIGQLAIIPPLRQAVAVSPSELMRSHRAA